MWRSNSQSLNQESRVRLSQPGTPELFYFRIKYFNVECNFVSKNELYRFLLRQNLLTNIQDMY